MVLIPHGKVYSVILMGKEHKNRIEKWIASRSALILPLAKQLNRPPRSYRSNSKPAEELSCL
jgi:hypothetical protein